MDVAKKEDVYEISPESFFPRARNPEERLLIAIICRAIADCVDGCEEAEEFLLDDSEEDFSFRWMCAHLDLDPSRFVKKLQSQRFILVKRFRRYRTA